MCVSVCVCVCVNNAVWHICILCSNSVIEYTYVNLSSIAYT